MKLLRHLWKRHVTGRPDQYQAYVSFPSRTDRPVGDVHDRIEELEYAFEGRLDIYARSQGVAVVTDRISAEAFDVDTFESILERIEDAYATTHRLAQLEKCRSIDGRLVTSYVVVPVKPLFPRSTADRSAGQVAPPTD
ncbi:hypothetical protein [Natrialba asiatica]|uniref:Uncharacterized protein n=1 Tax=Natrialba asiatica (strain ATCC 700177 / DSM 12278 / JCM 9576 / FERM P-10747 / NBRC 102637 / 172P1) TaxID=29540 RepID=M0AKQ6_NATA1|nr:hypothetical protein [Natrialba asiatica]ELY97958.1 hypothetical protein C481_18520 [Natrialba asiatica DSM 12278]